MKQVIQTIGMGLIILLNSCTFPKGDCTEASADMIHTISFNNFGQHDLDSVILMSYDASSDFTVLYYSKVIHAYQYDTLKSTSVAETPLIDIKLSYILNIVNTGQIFKLTGFTTRREICGKGLFNETYFNELASYYLNGQKKTDKFIEIDK